MAKLKEKMLLEKCEKCNKWLRRIKPYTYRCECWPKNIVMSHLQIKGATE